MELIVPAVVIVGATLVGELIYRNRSGTARWWGDLSQALYATVAFIIVVLIAIGGGQHVMFVAAILIILYWSVARTKWSDVREADVRAAIGGDD